MKFNECKHYIPQMDILLAYCECLYNIAGCAAGGQLHILLDDANIRDSDIIYCLRECLNHPNEPESNLGILICHEFIKMSMEQRSLFIQRWAGHVNLNCDDNCKNCFCMEAMYDE